MAQDGLVLSYAKALKKHNINYQKYLLVDVTDIADTCVYMAYIQLALYGIPAIVKCGNSLTQEIRFAMETPLYFLQYWKFGNFYNHYNKKIQETSEQTITIDKPIENQILYKEVTIKGNRQISLW